MQNLHKICLSILGGLSIILSVNGQPQWQYRSSMPTARQGMAAAALNGNIYVIGGAQTGHNALNIVEAYDVQHDSWQTGIAPLNNARTSAAAVALQNKIYLFGGRNHHNLISTVEVYDPAVNQWSIVSQIPTPREGLSAVVVDSVIWVIAGATFQMTSDIVEIYHPNTNSWTTLSDPLTVPRVAPVAAVVNNDVYVMGGFYFGPLNSYEKYVPGQGWEIVGSMLYSCGSAAGDVYNGQIWIVGGENQSGILDNVQYKDIPGQGNWLNGPALQTPRKNLAVVQVGNWLYAIGGATNNHMENGTNVVEALDLLTDITPPPNIVRREQLYVSANYPNPFNSSTIVDIYLNKYEDIQVGVLDILGQNVRQLYRGRTRGWQRIQFDGSDDNGNTLPSGIYFIYVMTPNERRMVKINFIK